MNPSITRGAVYAAALAFSVPVAAQHADSVQGQGAGWMRLRFATFDPMVAPPAVPAALQSTASQSLHIVQFTAVPTQQDRDAIARIGGQVIGYLPERAYVVRIPEQQVETARSIPSVRWVGDYHPAYRLSPELVQANAITDPTPVRYNLVVADKHNDKPALAAAIRAIGGVVVDQDVGGLLFGAVLTGPQLQQVAGFDQVLWIDVWGAPEEDMNNARIQGGGNQVETLAGYTGAGVNAHIYEGIEASHPDFTGGATTVRSSNAAQTHGHCTAGIVFGNGTSNPAVRGMAPDCGKFFTNYSTVNASRWQVFSDLVNIHDVSHTTASWGNPQTTAYTSVSAASDDLVFDHDIAWTQSQSNTGNQNSRPEAWAKNVFSIGAVAHFNDSNPGNDSWQAGNASIGPASDGRIKPTLCAYYDAIGTSDRTGAQGYSSGNWYSNFGGTSGATPIVAGHNVLAIQMFTDEVVPGFGRFGNPLRVPGGTTHENRPHFPTLKALQVVNARQYSFSAGSSNNRRQHQGWGFPHLGDMYTYRDRTFIVDEEDVLVQGQVRSHAILVAPGESSLKVCLNWNEPPANPAASMHLVNNLSLRVTSPNGQVYWGNNGLQNGVWSGTGGSEDMINSLECVFVPNPVAGGWDVEVLATSIVQDNHLETAAVDADYGLVVRGGTGTNLTFASFAAYGDGCPSSVVVPAPPCSQYNQTGGALLPISTDEHVWRIYGSGPFSIESIDVWSAAPSGATTVDLRIYTGQVPGATATVTAPVTIGTQPGFYTATFSPPLQLSGTSYLGLDTSGGNVHFPEVATGTVFVGYQRSAPNLSWAVLLGNPSYRIHCTPDYLVPTLVNDGLPQLGSSYDVDLADAPPVAFAVAVTGLSDTSFPGGPLPLTLPGTMTASSAGCDLLVSPDVLELAITTAAGTAADATVVPNNNSLVGVELFHQWVVLDAAANPAGLITSNAGRATVGN